VEKALRLRAIYSLGEAGDDRAYPVLEELCHARDREVREAAREAAEEWLMSSMAERFELDDDDESLWVEPDNPALGGFARNMWDNVLGTFSLN
jgi:HEAT repeat protein